MLLSATICSPACDAPRCNAPDFHTCRDGELAKFEAFLKSEQAQDIQVNVRGRQQLAYPIKGHWDGIYVLYQYASKRVTSQNVQKYLSTPPIGGEISILRHMTFLT